MVELQTVVFGIILVLIATPLFHLAVVFQKLGLMQSEVITFDKGIKGILLTFKKIAKNKWWLLGTIFGIVAWPMYLLSIGLVGFMVSEPINSIGIILLVIVANRYLQEKIAWYELLAILLLAISPILIAAAGISKVIVDLYAMVLPLIIFLAISGSITIYCFMLSIKTRGTRSEGLYIMLVGSLLLAIGGIFTNILAQAIIQANIAFTWYFWVEIFFGIFWGDYTHLWVFLAWWLMSITNLSSIAFYQSAFQKERVAIAFPIFDSIGLSIPILAGIFVFQQTFNNYTLFFIGIALILMGTLILGKFQTKFQTLDYNQWKVYRENYKKKSKEYNTNPKQTQTENSD
jgi:multidrug transporter EmrE-like cation transporter